jgi:hypothetical protein
LEGVADDFAEPFRSLVDDLASSLIQRRETPEDLAMPLGAGPLKQCPNGLAADGLIGTIQRGDQDVQRGLVLGLGEELESGP